MKNKMAVAVMAGLVWLTGCSDPPAGPDDETAIGDGVEGDGDDLGPDGAVPVLTWSDDVRPLFERVCAGCHGSAGCTTGSCFLDEPDQLKMVPVGDLCDSPTVAECLLETLVEGTMPPGGCTIGSFTCLDAAEVETVEAWLEAGAPE